MGGNRPLPTVIYPRAHQTDVCGSVGTDLTWEAMGGNRPLPTVIYPRAHQTDVCGSVGTDLTWEAMGGNRPLPTVIYPRAHHTGTVMKRMESIDSRDYILTTEIPFVRQRL